MQRLVISLSQLQDRHIELNDEQLHYLKRVLRLQSGDRFFALDGQGQTWITQLAHDFATIIESVQANHQELAVNVTLIVALPKGNSFEEIVRCCTELGVSTIIPTKSNHTLLKPSTHKLERWRRIANEAAEQSERQLVPTITELTPFDSVIHQQPSVNSDSQLQYICVARGDVPHLMTCLQSKIKTNSQLQNSPSIVIATGPEGGWTPAEIQQANIAGFQSVSLGKRILRAVTAPIVALSMAAAVWES